MLPNQRSTSLRQVSTQSFYASSFDVLGDEKSLHGVQLNQSYHPSSDGNKKSFSHESSEGAIPRITSRVVSDIMHDHQSDRNLGTEQGGLHGRGGDNQNQMELENEQYGNLVTVTPPRPQRENSLQFNTLLKSFDSAFCEFTFVLPCLRTSGDNNRISFDASDAAIKVYGDAKVRLFFLSHGGCGNQNKQH